MRRLLAFLFVAALAAAAPALAFVPQTITVDGNGTDWDQANLVDNDSLDTEIKDWCTLTPGNEAPMDLGRIYLTNDANFLYVGYFYNKYCFASPAVNLGIAFDVNGAAGGNTDPFGRKITWTDVVTKPDFVVYDVLDGFNYEVLYKWNAGTSVWDNASTQVNPSWGSGSNGLGIQDAGTFVEFKLPLTVLGVTPGTTIRAEWWVTQDNTSKGPLDAAYSDTTQTSTVSGTVFDLAAAKSMDGMFPFTIINVSDGVPPVVTSAAAVNFPLNPNKQFGLNTNKVDVAFNEPVDVTTGQVTTNYVIAGAVGRTVIDATRDPAATSVVHLTLSGSINAQATPWSVTVSGVKDIAGNLIAANGTTNVGRFFIHNVVFNGNMAVGLCHGSFAAADTFTVEGGTPPLTFELIDNAVMYDANADSVYNVTVPFNLPFDPDSSAGWADLQWKFGHRVLAPGTTKEFEPLGPNRTLHLTTNAGASQTVTGSWNNDDPVNFTRQAIDVIFQVDASADGLGAIADSSVTLNADQAPLSFTQPGLVMKDDGVAPDLAAGDKIYTSRVTFPTCTYKTVNWKVSVGIGGTYRYECANQGDRQVYLNDALYTSANPIVMPARKLDFCTVTDKAIKVVFKVDMARTAATVDSVVAVMGGAAPLTFTPPAPSAGVMVDDGTNGDAAAHDRIYTLPVTFPQGSPLTLNFKYAINDRFECLGFGDRSMALDDVGHSVANPIVRPINLFDYCSDPTAVGDRPGAGARGADFGLLLPAFPNPAARTATVRFTLNRAGIATLSVYDVVGRRIRTLAGGTMAAGPHEFVWDGRDGAGNRVMSGLYLVELAMDGRRLSHRLFLTR